ncbi:MAG: hypothetical protein V1659_02360 [Candidatus Woesearchaeota archaeon]
MGTIKPRDALILAQGATPTSAGEPGVRVLEVMKIGNLVKSAGDDLRGSTRTRMLAELQDRNSIGITVLEFSTGKSDLLVFAGAEKDHPARYTTPEEWENPPYSRVVASAQAGEQSPVQLIVPSKRFRDWNIGTLEKENPTSGSHLMTYRFMDGSRRVLNSGNSYLAVIVDETDQITAVRPVLGILGEQLKQATPKKARLNEGMRTEAIRRIFAAEHSRFGESGYWSKDKAIPTARIVNAVGPTAIVERASYVVLGTEQVLDAYLGAATTRHPLVGKSLDDLTDEETHGIMCLPIAGNGKAPALRTRLLGYTGRTSE